MPEVTLGRRAAKGTAVTLFGQAGKFAIQAVGLVVLSRIIAPEEFGAYVMIASLSGLAAVVGDFGLSYAAIQAKLLTHRQKSNLYWINVLLGTIGTIVFFLVAPALSNFYGQQESLTHVAQLMSIVFVLNGLTVQHRAELSRSLKFTALAISDNLSQALGLLAALLLALGGAGVEALVAQQLVAAVIVLIYSWIAAKWLPGLPSSSAPIKSFLIFGSNTLGGGLINYASSNADNIVLGKFASAVDVGIYGRMFQLFSMPLQQLASPLTRVALPTLSSLHDNGEQYMRYLLRAQVCLAYLFLGSFTLIAVTAPAIVEIVLGPSWTSGILVLQILSIGGLFQGLGYIYYWVFLSKARMDIQFRLGLISRTLMVGAIVACGPLGMYWVAAAAAAGLALNWLLYTAWGLRAAGVDARSLLLVACRPAAVFVPFGLISVCSWYFVFSAVGAWTFSGSLAAVFAVYCALVLVIFRRVRTDFIVICDTARMAFKRSGGK